MRPASVVNYPLEVPGGGGVENTNGQQPGPVLRRMDKQGLRGRRTEMDSPRGGERSTTALSKAESRSSMMSRTHDNQTGYFSEGKLTKTIGTKSLAE